MRLSIIVAMDNNQLIGKDNGLPWYLPADLAYFKKITTGKTVLMGRKTYDSIGKPLVNRRNVVISRDNQLNIQGCEVVASIEDALSLTKQDVEVMVIGGASFYQQILPKTDRLYITNVDDECQGDTYFPQFDLSEFIQLSCESHKPDERNLYSYNFTVWDRR